MNILVTALISYLILFHFFAFIIEAFLWKKPLGRKIFGLSEEVAEASASLAINQGVYNLFLVAGFIWSFLASEPLQFQVRIFFLVCATLAGTVGGVTAAKRIFLVQGLPALITLTALFY